MHKRIITLLCAASVVLSAPVMAKMHLRPDAPARYEVQKGDTLWHISGKYLYSPWQWPQLWNANRNQIRNPQQIYPGQVLILGNVNGQPRLQIDTTSIPTIKLQPRIHNLSSGYGISTINVDFYRLFMQSPQVMTKDQLRKAPKLVSGPDNRMMYGAGDRVYADRSLEPGRYLVFRLDQEIRDPDTHKSLGQLVRFNGQVVTLPVQNSALKERDEQDKKALPDDEYYTRKNAFIKLPTQTAQPLTVTSAVSEISDGDYLLKMTDEDKPFQIMPHAPDTQIKAKIVGILDGIVEAGPFQTVVLNAGTAQGIDKGTVLSLYKKSRQLKKGLRPDKSSDHGVLRYLSIPAEEVGMALVYRVSDNLSSAIILDARTNINVGDLAMNPGHDLDDVTVNR
ncbi:LysM peptidoglycan-binding domain-containing protein [Neisseriaceae bacterium ESL0693]|nr:LysM peptidoglycan-binding domain-containing protein [Neisseriaceae bacterium ESL0693]